MVKDGRGAPERLAALGNALGARAGGLRLGLDCFEEPGRADGRHGHMGVLQEHLVVGVARARVNGGNGRPNLAGRRRRHRPRRIDHDRALRPRFRRHHDGQKVSAPTHSGHAPPRACCPGDLGQKRPARRRWRRDARGPVGRRHKRAGVPRVLLRLGQRDARRQVAVLPERHDRGAVEPEASCV